MYRRREFSHIVTPHQTEARVAYVKQGKALGSRMGLPSTTVPVIIKRPFRRNQVFPLVYHV